MRRTAVAATALALCAAVTTTGCSSNTSKSSSKGGGTFTAILTHIDPKAPINPYNQTTNSFRGYNAMMLGWSKNTPTDPNQFYPAIAKSWELSSDGTKLTVHIQPNAKWSDDKPVTADDLKLSAAVAYAQGGSAFAAIPGTAGGTVDVKVIDDKTVEFDQNAAKPLNTWFANVMTMYVLPAHVWSSQVPSDIWDTIHTALTGRAHDSKTAHDTITALGKKLIAWGPDKDVSAGPFVLSRVTTSEALLTKNKSFYDAGRIAPSQVVIKNYQDNSSIVNLLLNGQIDGSVYVAVSESQLDKILAVKGNQVVSGASPVQASLVFNESKKPFDNVHVRRGIAYLIDRAQVTKIGESSSGKASPYPAGLTATQLKGWSVGTSDLNAYSTDTAKAAAEFQQAGMVQSGGKWTQADGTPFTVPIQTTSDFNDWTSATSNVAAQLKAAGVDSTVTASSDYSTYLSDLAAGKFTVSWWLTALGPSSYNIFQRLYGSANGWTAAAGGGVAHAAPGQKGNWIGEAETADVPGLGTVNPGDLTNQLSQVPVAQQKQIVAKLAQFTNDQVPAIAMWDYVNQNFINTTHFTKFPPNDSDVLRQPQGVWMQLGYIQAK
jgi:peptide/nickel transport system substrate-binding protein